MTDVSNAAANAVENQMNLDLFYYRLAQQLNVLHTAMRHANLEEYTAAHAEAFCKAVQANEALAGGGFAGELVPVGFGPVPRTELVAKLLKARAAEAPKESSQ